MRKKTRSMLTLTSIVIGVISVVIIGTIGNIGTKVINDELSGLGVDGISLTKIDKSNGKYITNTDIETVKAMSFTQSLAPIMVELGSCELAAKKNETMVWGIDSNANHIFSVELKHGKFINSDELKNSAKVCMVDEAMALSNYKRTNIVGKEISITIADKTEKYTVVGVTTSDGNLLQNFIGGFVPSFVYIPYTTMQQMTNKGGFEQVAIKINSEADLNSAGEKIVSELNLLNSSENMFKYSNITSQREKLSNLFNIVTIILSMIAGISLVVSGLGIMTVMFVSVTERTREIGLKKAIGAKNSSICMEFILESFTLSFLGGIIGIALGLIVCYIGATAFNVKFAVNTGFIAVIMLVCLLQGCVFGVLPSIKAAAMKPVDALRHD